MGSLIFGQALLPEDWARDVRLTFAGGKIVAVEPAAAAMAGEARFDVGLPGLPDLHSQAFQRGMAGLAETREPADDDVWAWREVMYRFLDRMPPDDIEAFAANAYAEMLEGGFTRVGEFHYLHHQPDGAPYTDIAEMAARIAAAAAETGIGVTLMPCFYAHGGFGGEPPVSGQRRFLNGTQRFARLVEATARIVANVSGGVLGVAPHSLRAATPEELAAVTGLRPGAPVHIHASEQIREIATSVACSGQPTDCNPGTSPLTSLLLTMNMAAALMRLTVEECLLGVTREAARALGRLAAIGTLEPGKSCDLAISDIENPAELVYRMGFNPLHARIWSGR